MQEEMVQERVGQLVTLVFQEEEEIQVEEGVEAGEEIRYTFIFIKICIPQFCCLHSSN